MLSIFRLPLIVLILTSSCGNKASQSTFPSSAESQSTTSPKSSLPQPTSALTSVVDTPLGTHSRIAVLWEGPFGETAGKALAEILTNRGYAVVKLASSLEDQAFDLTFWLRTLTTYRRMESPKNPHATVGFVELTIDIEASDRQGAIVLKPPNS